MCSQHSMSAQHVSTACQHRAACRILSCTGRGLQQHPRVAFTERSAGNLKHLTTPLFVGTTWDELALREHTTAHSVSRNAAHSLCVKA